MSSVLRPKVAIVLVPGYGVDSVGSALDRLGAALCAVQGVSPPRLISVAGTVGLRLAVHGPRSFDLDLFGVSWADQERQIGEENPIAQLISMLGLSMYWFGRGYRWPALLERFPLRGHVRPPALRCGRPKGSARVENTFADRERWQVEKHFSRLGWWGAPHFLLILLIVFTILFALSELGLFSQVLIASVVLTALTELGLKGWTASQLRRAEYLRDYLSSRPEGPPRAIARNRVLDMLLSLSEQGYEHQILAAHSHGAAIIVDLLGSDPPLQCPRLYVATMGSSVIGLCPWADWMDSARRRALEHPSVSGWIDLYSPTDFLCGPIPGHAEKFGSTASIQLNFEATRWERKLLQTHDRYFENTKVAQQLIKLGICCLERKDLRARPETP